MEKLNKTFYEQIEFLKSKGLIFKDEVTARKILSRENYYNLIDGYNNLFLEISSDNYVQSANFDELHSLFRFDRNLRNALFGYLLQFETTIKARVSYHFSETNPIKGAYLNEECYIEDDEVSPFLKKLTRMMELQEKRNSVITHYKESFGCVPLGVFVNVFTFGQIKKMYMLLPGNLKNKIAHDFYRDYRSENEVKTFFSSEMLESILHAINFFRNACAHEESLYNYKLLLPPRTASISRVLGIDNDLIKNGNLFTTIVFLKLVLPKPDYQSLKNLLFMLFSQYEQEFNSVEFSRILQVMGFPPNWYQIV